jgi:hypothetical protein
VALALGLAACALFAYRSSVVPDPGGPRWEQVTPEMFLARTVVLVYPAFYYAFFGIDVGTHVMAFALFVLAGAWLRLRCCGSVVTWLSRPFAGVWALLIAAFVAVVAAYLTGTLVLFTEPRVVYEKLLPVFVRDWAAFYTVYLFVVYRNRYATALSWLLLYFAHMPVFYTSVTWHYTLIGWFYRAQYLALLALILWDHWGITRRMERLLSRAR